MITAVIDKKHEKNFARLVFGQKGDRVYIRDVVGKYARKTDLVPGLKVVKVGGMKVLSAAHATILLQESGDKVTVQAEGKCVETNKNAIGTLDESLFLKQLGKGRVHMTNSMFPRGTILFAINGIPVGSVKSATKLLTKATYLKLVLKDAYGKDNVHVVDDTKSTKSESTASTWVDEEESSCTGSSSGRSRRRRVRLSFCSTGSADSIDSEPTDGRRRSVTFVETAELLEYCLEAAQEADDGEHIEQMLQNGEW